MSIRRIEYSKILLVACALSFNIDATVYFIAPAPTGNNNNSGSQGQPWATIQKAAQTMIDGDTVLVRTGTYNSLSTITVSGTASKYITYKNFPGERPVLDFSEVSMSLNTAAIQINKANYIRIEGFSILNSQGMGIIMIGTSATAPVLGTHLSNILVSNFRGVGIQGTYAKNYLIDHVELDGKKVAGCGGIHLGAWSCNNGVISNCKVHDLGVTPGSQQGGTDMQIGYWIVNSKNVSFINDTAYNNAGDGFDVGVYGATASNFTDSIKYINCIAFNNADGFGQNAGENFPGVMHLFYVNCMALSNNCINFNQYGGPAEYTWTNCLAYNGNQANFAVGPDGWTDFGLVTTHIYNCIGYKPACIAYPRSNLGAFYIKGMHFTLDSDYNYWGAKGTEPFCYWDALAGSAPYAKTYPHSTVGSTTSSWYTLNEDGHLHCDGHSLSSANGDSARFKNEALGDYTLQPASSLRGKGIDLKNKSFYIPEMAYDRNGKPRISFDIGPYEYLTTNTGAQEVLQPHRQTQPAIKVLSAKVRRVGILSITLDPSFSPNETKRVKLYTLSGKLMFERETSGYHVDIDCGNGLPKNGICVIAVQENQNIVSQKLILQQGE